MSDQIVNDARLRFDGLMEHVDHISEGIQGFPGALNLRNLATSYKRMATALYATFDRAVDAEPDERIRISARNKMVDLLAKEWEIIFQLSANAKLFGEYLDTHDDFSWLNVLVKAAQKDLNLSGWEFIVVPRVSLRYALTSFVYAPDFSILEIPNSSLNTAWEWSVLWHELAGRIARDMKKSDETTFDVPSVLAMDDTAEVEKKVFASIDEMMAKLQRSEAVGSPLLNTIRKLFSLLPSKPRWSRDWVEELFEDACSALTFGDDFIPVLTSILNRNENPNDRRHPPIEIRVRMAKRLLGRQVSSGDAELDAIEAEAAGHILELVRSTGLRLPVQTGQMTEVHQGLQAMMKKYADNTVTFEDVRNFKKELNDMMANNPEYEKKGVRDFSVDITTLPEVASDDYKRMLGIVLSKSDPATPLTGHGENDFGSMSITEHGTLHVFWHSVWNHR